MFICVGKKEAWRRLALISVAAAAFFALPYIAKRTETMPASGYEWGVHFENPGQIPRPNLSDRQLNPLGAYFHGNTRQRTIYLTFDSGYENGNTEKILDALKKHGAPACFFAVGPYIERHPEIVKRMAREGHTVGNHTYSHPDMRGKSRRELTGELEKTRRRYRRVTGEEMPKFYRPPEGKFTLENLRRAKEAGYVTLLWSSAYVDWQQNNQPGEEEAFEKIEERTFDGAIFLLHTVSATNAAILDRQLTRWEERGYAFGDVKDLVKNLRRDS